MNLNRLLAVLLAAGIAVLGARPSHAQYKVAQVAFDNPGPYTQQQLAAVAGLKPGDPATADTLQAGAQRLSDTGFFDDIGAEIGTANGKVIARFKLKPIPTSAMLPVSFEDFVWLSPQEITAALQAALPLYQGYLPEASVQADTIDKVLVQALAAKGVSARVTHDTIEPTLVHPLRSIAYWVSHPMPVVANVHLTGVTQDLVPLVQASVNATAHTRYNAGLAGTLTADTILAPLLDAGYIHAALDALSVTPAAASGDTVPVVVSASLSAGSVYHVSALSFAGDSLLSAADFASTAKLHPGDIASRKAMLETLRPLDTAYRRQGYMDVILKAQPVEDAAAHTVAYTITAVPGEQYRVSKFSAEGLDPAAEADVNKYFKLKPGELYDPGYVAGFLKNNTALRSLAHYNGSWKTYANPNNHTVELVLTFAPGALVNVR